MLINSIIFSVAFLIISNWFQLLSFLKLVVGPKIKTESLDDKWIKSIVRKKTGL